MGPRARATPRPAALAVLLLALAAPRGAAPQSARDTVTRVLTPTAGTPAVHLGQRLRLTLGAPSTTALPDPRQLGLYLDGRHVRGLPAERVGFPRRDLAAGGLTMQDYEFTLAHSDSTSALWADLLGRPTSLTRTLDAGLGPVGGPEYPRPATARVTLVLSGWPLALLWLFTIGGLALLILFVAVRTSLLRDPSTAREAKGPYSLARVAMAFWTFLVAAAYLGIGIVRGEAIGIVTRESLLLVGIVAATGAVSALLTGRTAARRRALLRGLRDDSAVSQATAHQLLHEARELMPGPERAELVERAKRNERTALEAGAHLELLAADGPVSRGFWWDILSDGDGPSIYRLQNVVWNLILGFVFVEGVYRTLAFPPLGAPLLVLLAISNALYLGVKSREAGKPGPERPRDEARPVTEGMRQAQGYIASRR